MMQVVLQVAGEKTNVRQMVVRSDTLIGRSSECQLKIASNVVSRRHCRMSLTESQVLLRDLGSANGTFVNGRRLPPEQDVPLSPGSLVTVGPLKFTVQFDPPATAENPHVETEAPEAALPSPEPSAGADEVPDFSFLEASQPTTDETPAAFDFDETLRAGELSAPASARAEEPEATAGRVPKKRGLLERLGWGRKRESEGDG